MRHQRLLANLGVILALGVGAASAEQGGNIRREDPPAPSREMERSAVNYAGRLGGTGPTRVIGSVIDVRQVPVGNVRVQLRNLDTGNVEMEVDSNELGEYEFTLEEPGSYIVEMVLVDGYIVGISNAGSIAQSETLNTVVQLPGRWDFGRQVMVDELSFFLGMSAETTLTAATLQIAAEQDIQPANAGTPASPQ